jgi:hypothetical protein
VVAKQKRYVRRVVRGSDNSMVVMVYARIEEVLVYRLLLPIVMEYRSTI